MLPADLVAITPADIARLIDDAVPEDRTLDYKEGLPGSSDSERKEFLADVSAMANTAGGHLLFGIAELRDSGGRPTGSPASAPGVPVNADAEILKLENAIRDGIAPRIPAIQFRAIPGFANGPVLILRVGQSWIGPHMVTYKSVSRFYTRTNAGKVPMDVREIRSAFVRGHELATRVSDFRNNRLSKLLAGELAFRVPAGPKTVLHIVPVSAFDPGEAVDPRSVREQQAGMQPICCRGWSQRYNLDGFATYSPRRDGFVDSYVQVFRSGALEAVEATIMTDGERQLMPPAEWEGYMMTAIERFVPLVAKLGGHLPLTIMATLVGVRGVQFVVDRRLRMAPSELDRDVVLLPDVVIEDATQDLGPVVRPIFDSLWQAADIEGSPQFDEHGDWRGRRLR
jgi:hypothetical protein